MPVPSWQTPSRRGPGDYAYGNTQQGGTTLPKAMAVLSNNQRYFAGDAGSGTYDHQRAPAFYQGYAVPRDERYITPLRYSLGFVRRWEFLVYNAKSAVLKYGNPSAEDEIRTYGLEDVEGANSSYVLDLSAVPGLHVGMFYWIEPTDEENRETIRWAFEWRGAGAFSPDPTMQEQDSETLCGVLSEEG